jgi:hypothetical protein
MRATTTIMAAAALLAQTLAQKTNLLNVTLSTTGARDCGQGTTGEGNAVTFALHVAPQYSVCINLNETFSNPNTTHVAGVGCRNCGATYSIFGAQHFNAKIDYRQIWYRQPGPEDGKQARVGITALPVENCREGAVAPDKKSIYPWYRWSCASEDGECDTLSYGIKSFRISHIADDEVGDDDCDVAEERGGSDAEGRGVRVGGQGGWSAVVVALAGAAYSLLV